MKFFACLAVTLTISGASIDGAKISYAVSGKGATTVVFVHGWTCDSSSWSAQVPAVSKNHQVVTLDLPGHGKSEAPKDGNFSMDLFANAVEAVRGEIHADKIVLVGHSMGTPVIRQYGRLFPQHVQALVLVDGTVIDARVAPGLAKIVDQFQGPEGMRHRLEFIQSMLFPPPSAELKEKITKMMTAAPGTTAAGAMAAMTDPAMWKDDSLPFPALGIYSEHTRAASRELLVKAFPSVDYRELRGTGHFLMLEKPDEFNRILLDFLNKLQ